MEMRCIYITSFDLHGNALQVKACNMVTIDNKLTFQNHIAKSIGKGYGALPNLAKASKYIPLGVRLKLYKSLVRPHLEYCPTMKIVYNILNLALKLMTIFHIIIICLKYKHLFPSSFC